jgi:hypothetical protein
VDGHPGFLDSATNSLRPGREPVDNRLEALAVDSGDQLAQLPLSAPNRKLPDDQSDAARSCYSFGTHLQNQ